MNLYVYVGNNPLKYIDLTGNDKKIGTISWHKFVTHINKRLKHNKRLNLWIGEDYLLATGSILLLDLVASTNIRNIMLEHTGATPGQSPITDIDFIDLILSYRPVTPETRQALKRVRQLVATHNFRYIGSEGWTNTCLDVCTFGPKNSYIALVGSCHVAEDTRKMVLTTDVEAYPAYRHTNKKENIALLPLEEVEKFRADRRTMKMREYGVWVADRYGVKGNAFLILGSKSTMRREFGRAAQPVPENLNNLQNYQPRSQTPTMVQRFASLFRRK